MISRRKILLGSIIATNLALLGDALPAMVDFMANLSACPVGPFVTANKRLAWNSPALVSLVDEDVNGDFFSIMANGGRSGGNCQRTFYPQGSYGLTPRHTQRYTLDIGNPGVPVNVEWDWMFEPGFDLSLTGKIGPGIAWGPTSGTSGGLAQAVWWRNNSPTTSVFEFILQNQRRGNTLGPEFLVRSYSPNTIVPGQWYHFRLQIMGGPNGFANYWLDGVQMAHVSSASPAWQLTNAADDASVVMATFFGGDIRAAAKNDSYSRQDNIHISLG